MALVLGTNSGFVTVAPTTDPTETAGIIDTIARDTKDTSPSTAVKITEIGWWCDNATEESNFEVGLYAADGAVVPGEAGTRLFVSATNAKGTTAGWKRATVDWSISSSTSYWLAVQCDNTATTTNIDVSLSGGSGIDAISATLLPDPFSGGGLGDVDGMIAIYAVWEAAAVTSGNVINIGDVWSSITTIQINIGDVWKTVTKGQVNISDVWKTFYGS